MHKITISNIAMKNDWNKFFKDNADCFELAHPRTLDAASLTHTSTVWASFQGAICQAVNIDYLKKALSNPNIACVIADVALNSECVDVDKIVLFAENSSELFLKAHLFYSENLSSDSNSKQIAATAKIHPSASISDEAIIGDHVSIGANVSISGPATIGDNTVISANAVIGEEGLFAKKIEGELRNIPHCGGVMIGNNCYIHSGAVIVRSAFAGLNTELGQSSHVGVMTNIGHDVKIGEETVISSNCVVAGRADIGDRCWIGASCTISNGVSVGHDADVKIGAVVVNDVPAKAVVSGNFAFSHKRHLKQHVSNWR